MKPAASCTTGSITKAGMIGEDGQRCQVQREPGVFFRPGASCIHAQRLRRSGCSEALGVAQKACRKNMLETLGSLNSRK